MVAALTSNQRPPPTGDPGARRTELAVLRTSLAAERSLMAWVRTSLALTSFGFTLYKVLEAGFGVGQQVTPSPEGPRRFGMFLVALGVLAAGVGVVEYARTVRKLRRYLPVPVELFGPVVALAVAALGLFLMIAIGLRLAGF